MRRCEGSVAVPLHPRTEGVGPSQEDPELAPEAGTGGRQSVAGVAGSPGQPEPGGLEGEGLGFVHADGGLRGEGLEGHLGQLEDPGRVVAPGLDDGVREALGAGRGGGVGREETGTRQRQQPITTTTRWGRTQR